MASPDGEDEGRFLNDYRCGECGHEWTDEWSCMCDDTCPECGARNMSPYKSDDLDGGVP
jgi:predicted  nucleic acid-binding Zn-ribbon protein